MALIALAVYTLTLAPDISWAHDGADGGDLIAAVMTNGVPHPPGYPTYLFLTWPFKELPLGNPAWRLNFFSALAAAGAAALTMLTVASSYPPPPSPSPVAPERGQCKALVAGAAAGLALAFSPVLWSQAVITEVYALGAFFAALLAWLAVHSRENLAKVCGLRSPGEPSVRTPSQGLFWGAALGLAIGAQPTLALFGLMSPLVLGRRGKAWLEAGLGLLIGLAVFLVLPWRAMSGPPINWGDARTLDGVVWLVSAQLYRGMAFALPLSALGGRLVAWAVLIVRQFTPVGAMLAAWGWRQLWTQHRGLALATLAIFAGLSLFAIGYDTTDSYVYLIPAFVLGAVWLGVGLGDLLSKLNQQRWLQRRGLWIAALCTVALYSAPLALPLAELVTGWPTADVHADRTAVTFGARTMQQAPPAAILVTKQDSHTFTLWYYHYARGQRPDITIVDRDLLPLPWYARSLARESGLSDLANAPDPWSVLDASGRPLCSVSLTDLECP